MHLTLLWCKPLTGPGTQISKPPAHTAKTDTKNTCHSRSSVTKSRIRDIGRTTYLRRMSSQRCSECGTAETARMQPHELDAQSQIPRLRECAYAPTIQQSAWRQWRFENCQGRGDRDPPRLPGQSPVGISLPRSFRENHDHFLQFIPPSRFSTIRWSHGNAES